MTAFLPFGRALALCALGSFAAGAAHAQASWDLDSCTPGTKTAALYDNCGGTGAGVGGVTVDVKAYSTNSAATNFSAASLVTGSSYIGVKSAGEVSTSPHHAIDNYSSSGHSYELVHLNFSGAVDLSNVTANWVYSDGSSSSDNGNFYLFRWDVNAGTPDPTITAFNPNSMTGWSLVTQSSFDGQYSQSVSDGTYFSSHWLIATKFGGGNDAFKLGTVSALNVCVGTNKVNSNGACVPGSDGGSNVPEPATLAMVLLAGLGIRTARRQRRQA